MKPVAHIGIFDSGIGGFSILSELLQKAPDIKYSYVADTKFNPYGLQSHSQILTRSHLISEFLLQQSADQIVIACNTATAHAIKSLRSRFKDILFIGIEPGIRPAVRISETKRIGVLATKATLTSQKYLQLKQVILHPKTVVIEDNCPSLVEHIETPNNDQKINQTLKKAIDPLISQQVDTIVLACTHFGLVQKNIQGMYPQLNIINPALAVVKHTLTTGDYQMQSQKVQPISYFTSGDTNQFSQQIQQYLSSINAQYSVKKISLSSSI